jgi:hypothetical protein
MKIAADFKIGAVGGIAPTLRTKREEWGTRFIGRVLERLGHPPTVRPVNSATDVRLPAAPSVYA